MKIKISFNLKELKINKVIRYFILADLIFLGGWGLISPVFAVFVLEEVSGSALFTIGLVAAFFWIVKSIVQIPVALYLDRQKGEKADLYALIFSLTLAGFAALFFVFVKTIPALFFVQFIHATAMGFYIPSWSALFSRHLDKKHYAFDWSLDSTTIGFAYALTAILGGTIAGFLGFKYVFVLVGACSFLGAFIIFLVPKMILRETISGDKTRTENEIQINMSE